MLKVMTLNINFYGTKHGDWTSRKPLIARAIAEADADVVALQAVKQDPNVAEGMNQALQIGQLLPQYDQIVFEPATRHADNNAEGSAFLSRIELAAVDHLKLTRRTNHEDPFDRIVLHARVDLPSGPLQLFNAHFSWVAEQASDNVREALPYLEASNEAKLLVGDLNASPDAENLRQLSDAGWVDLWARLQGQDPGFTFEADQPSLRIDYAWASPDLASRCNAIQIIRADQPGGVRLSDHFGLLATFDLET